jgi:menaquinone-dependent protoporphyrinogen IX oxidase
MEVLGKKPSILYSIALCYYKQHQPGQALKYLAQLIEKVRLAAHA